MKPIKLEMEAFGPYLKPTSIDFNNLPKNLTLITGNTGSGKTTIFDAICCALFGETSGRERSFSQMRSEIATDKQKTRVKFVFELKGKQYEITRSPSYLKKKANSDGYTKTLPKAELLMPDKTVIQKTNTVNEKIKEVLGIEKNEFRQIVMIAQNDFMAMIKGTDKKQEEIFNRIFNANLFENFSTEVRNQKNISQNKVESIVQNIINVLNNSGLEYNPDDLNFEFINTHYLTDLIDQSYQKLENEEPFLEKQVQQNTNLLDQHRLKMKQSEDLVKEFNEFESSKIKLKEIETKEPKIKQIKDSVNKAEKTRDIVSEQFNLVEKLKRDQEGLKNNLAKIKGKYDNLFQLGKELDKDLNQFSQNTLDGYRISYEKSKSELSKYSELEKLQIELNRLNNEYDQINGQEILSKEKLEKIQQRLEPINIIPEEQFNNRLDSIKIKLDNKTCHLKFLREFYLDFKNFNKKIVQLNTLKIQLESFHQAFQLSNQNYQQAYESYIQNQAAFLAQDLKPDEPCPVCGSKSHPHPAKSTGYIINQEELKELEKLNQENKQELEDHLNGFKVSQRNLEFELNQLKNNYRKLTDFFQCEEQEQFGRVIEEIQERINSFNGNKNVDLNTLDELFQRGYNFLELIAQELKSEINQIKNDQSLCLKEQEKNSKLALKKEQLEINKDELTKYLEKIQQEKNNINEKLIASNITISNLKETLEFKTLDEASTVCKELEEKYLNYEQDFKSIKDKVKNNKQETDRLQGSLKMLNNNLNKTEDELNGESLKLIECLKQAGLKDENEYLETIMKPEKLQNLKFKIEEFQNQSIRVHEHYKTLKQKLENSATRF